MSTKLRQQKQREQRKEGGQQKQRGSFLFPQTWKRTILRCGQKRNPIILQSSKPDFKNLTSILLPLNKNYRYILKSTPKFYTLIYNPYAQPKPKWSGKERIIYLIFQHETFPLIQKETYFMRISAPSSYSFLLRTQKFQPVFFSYMTVDDTRIMAKYKGALQKDFH